MIPTNVHLMNTYSFADYLFQTIAQTGNYQTREIYSHAPKPQLFGWKGNEVHEEFERFFN